MSATPDVRVWACPTHGLTEMTLSVFEEGGKRWEECPVSMGFEDVCHMRLDGPFVVQTVPANA